MGDETGAAGLMQWAPFALIGAVFVWVLLRRRRRPGTRADRTTEAAARAAVEAELRRRHRGRDNAGGPNDGAPGGGHGGDGGND
ncbi:hypothetical protein [Albimonas pacifica]|uniref:Uncharacterized protein n=1 Tax=Albimonas pacifica TaxID=1114924 RepID=A0A1I3CQR7_9RHOB|nr:hypothetical protein [Albimonas pacifica]SFH76579.1 hypothetical protein SAMN05216258_102137 [Albimonas pacifica]